MLFSILTLFLFRAFVFSDRMLFGSDTLGLGYVVRALYADALRTLGHVPHWAPHILGGTPFLEALSAGDSLYPPSLVLLLLTETYRAIGWKLVLHVFLAGLFMFGWIRAIGGSRSAALLAGTAYMSAPFLVSLVRPGHDGKIFVTALAPLLFWAVERHYVRPGLRSIAGIALVVTLVILTTHFQMAYFLFGAAGLYAVARAVQSSRASGGSGVRSVRSAAVVFGLFLGASGLGVVGGGVQFFPAVDYVREYSRRIQTTREAAGEAGAAWSSSWSLHPEEAMSLVVPEFAGNSAGGAAWTERTYWGRNVFKDNHEYAGLAVLLLAAVSFLGAARRELRWFFAALGALSLAFALGEHTPVWGLFYRFVPGIRMFRAPSQAIFLFGFAAATLAALGLDRVLNLLSERDGAQLGRVQRLLWAGVACMGVLALLLSTGLFMPVWTGLVYPGLDDAKRQVLEGHLPNIVRGAWLAGLVALATAGLVAAAARGWISSRALIAGLVLTVAIDEARIDSPFIQTLDFEEWAAPDPNIQAILERETGGEPFRLLSLVRQGQDVLPAMHGIELAAGHHPNDLARYRELIGMVGSGFPLNLVETNVRMILNVRYILWPDVELGTAPEGTVVSRTQYAGGQPYHTLLADIGLPRARLVGDAVVKNDDEAVEYILSQEHDPRMEAVLAEEPPITLPGGVVEGGVRWLERTADVLRLSVEADRPALLVVADNWYPGWKATVNGRETEILRAYHTLRAVPVPAGSSTVEMRYESALLYWSWRVSVVVLLSLLAMGAYGWRRERTLDLGA